MPFTVSCAICDSRFLLGDDLYQRKVSGRVVTVKCRTCNAAISVDATEPATLPGQRQTRRARRVPPRPKHKEGEPGTATPLPDSAVISAASESDSEADEHDRQHEPRSTRATRAEFIDDIEEPPPPSSSGAPSLESLIHETAPKRQADPAEAIDFLVASVNADDLGGPTIDVTAFAKPILANHSARSDDTDRDRTPRVGIRRPVAAEVAGLSLAPSHLDVPVDVEIPRPGRARNFTPAPEGEVPGELSVTRRRRVGVAVFALVTAAATVLAIVGVRGRSLSYSADEAQGAEHAPDNAVATQHAAQAQTAAVTPAAALTVPSAAAPTEPAATADATVAAPLAKASPAVTKRIANAAPVATSVAASDSPPALAESAKPAEAEAEAESPPASEPIPEPAAPDAEFDRSAAIAALQGAAAQAAACRTDGDPSGVAQLMITFAPSGRVTTATVEGPPFAGTTTGGCIANAMRQAQVPAFAGERVTVSKQIVIE